MLIPRREFIALVGAAIGAGVVVDGILAPPAATDESLRAIAKDYDHVIVLSGSASPTSRTKAGRGSLYMRHPDSHIYINTGTSADPIWTSI